MTIEANDVIDLLSLIRKITAAKHNNEDGYVVDMHKILHYDKSDYVIIENLKKIAAENNIPLQVKNCNG